MKRIHLYVAGIAVALVPAILGLTGNASFSQSVPVRVPEQAATIDATPSPDADDRGRRNGGHGADDGPTHDADDDHGRRGADDSPTPDVDDDGDRHRRGENSGHGDGGEDNSGPGGGGDDNSGPGSSSGSGDDGEDHSGSDDSEDSGGSGGHGSDD